MDCKTERALTMADVLILERAALEYRAGGWVYCSKPYPCSVDEALSHFRPFHGPKFTAGVMADKDTAAGGATIQRTDKETIITLPPLKGSRKRKPYIIKLWV